MVEKAYQAHAERGGDWRSVNRRHQAHTINGSGRRCLLEHRRRFLEQCERGGTSIAIGCPGVETRINAMIGPVA